uniref:C-type lectin domain-containing protein n=1 Tax=Amphilophus citrinellus TaxID=61819 RepID=A0A3Q0QRD9_AMPCI
RLIFFSLTMTYLSVLTLCCGEAGTHLASGSVGLYCRKYHTDLTSIRNKNEKSSITLIWKGSDVQYIWICLYRDPWAFWSDNSTSIFTSWSPSESNNYVSNEYRAAFNLNSGEWGDGTCSKMKIDKKPYNSSLTWYLVIYIY